MSRIIILIILLLTVSCSSLRELTMSKEEKEKLIEQQRLENEYKQAVIKKASAIVVGKGDPENASFLGPVTGYDGGGCGGFGTLGNYENAILSIQIDALNKGANYVQFVSITEPHLRAGCFDNQYKITGNAYLVEKNFEKNKVPNGIEKLKELKSLLDANVITKQEFEEQKKQILKSGI